MWMQRAILKSAQDIVFDQILELQHHILAEHHSKASAGREIRLPFTTGDLHKLDLT